MLVVYFKGFEYKVSYFWKVKYGEFKIVKVGKVEILKMVRI